ncbi:MAG: tetratricopeptide repeat protein, partial [Proteobacteria bacterium]|nr:tetratricopeptide repeat protein [Pseudomonadota bacterium]
MNRAQRRRQQKQAKKPAKNQKRSRPAAVSDLQALLQEGLRAHQAGQLTDAEAAYRRVLGLDADHADANHLLGVIAHQVGDHRAAVELIGTAIRHNPTDAAYHCNLGNALHELGRLDEAAASQRQAIALKDDYAKAHNNLGSVL